MGNWFSSEAKETVVINNKPSTVEPIMQTSSLNLSLEEILKETAIVVLIIFTWEYIKHRIQQRAEAEAAKIVAA